MVKKITIWAGDYLKDMLAAQMYTGCMAVLRQEARPDAGLKKAAGYRNYLFIMKEISENDMFPVPVKQKSKVRRDKLFPGLFKELMFVIGGETCATVRKWRRNFNSLTKSFFALKAEKGALIPILHKAQDIFGYLPYEVQERIAEGLVCPWRRFTA